MKRGKISELDRKKVRPSKGLVARIKNATLFAKVIKLVEGMGREGNLMFTNNNLSLYIIDGAKISILKVVIPREGFLEFSCERDVTLGFNFEKLSKSIKPLCKPDVELMVEYENDNDYVEFTFTNPSVGTFKYKMSLIVVDMEVLEVDEEKEKVAEIEIDPKVFVQAVNFLDGLDTNGIRIKYNAVDHIIFECEDQNNPESGRFKPDSCSITPYEGIDQQYSSCFPSKKLKTFAEAWSISSGLVITLHPEGTPILLTYKLNEGFGTLRYFLAPKISNNE